LQNFSFATATSKKCSFVGRRPKNCKSLCIEPKVRSNRLLQQAQGYGTEALSLLIDYGFKALNVHNILLRVYSYNKNAIRCYEKIGFKNIGVRREALRRNLETHDILYMDLLPQEFYEQYQQTGR
jgi:ribosomal protein S18 acetylase RimI-like enzyme